MDDPVSDPPASDNVEKADALRHSGEIEMARRYPNPVNRWNDESIRQLIRTRISERMGQYLSELPFFFIATSSAGGHCDASFRGRDVGPDGPLPLIALVDPQTLIFPDYAGNGTYQSLGNIHQNPHIGMLFMDFERQRRFRINGRAEVRDADDAIRAIWPGAQAYVRVSIEQAFGNCKARIPRMTLQAGSMDRDE